MYKKGSKAGNTGDIGHGTTSRRGLLRISRVPTRGFLRVPGAPLRGDVAAVSVSDGGNHGYTVRRADPSGHRAYSLVQDGSGTYLLPSDADLTKLDRELFNVDYLVQNGYHERDSLPVIVAAVDASQQDAVAAIIEAHGGQVTLVSKLLPLVAGSLPTIPSRTAPMPWRPAPAWRRCGWT